MWSFFDLIITESRLSIVRFDHSCHLMSTLIKSSAHLPDYWAISHGVCEIKWLITLFKGIETVKTNINSSFFPLGTLLFRFWNTYSWHKIGNWKCFAATMTPVVYFCRSHRYRCSLKVAIQRSFARSKF